MKTKPNGFDSLGLSALTTGVATAVFPEPTVVQREVIPVAMQGVDVLACAQNGPGKTAAFVLSTIERVVSDKHGHAQRGARALVLAPNHELATYICETFDQLGRGNALRSAVFSEGSTKATQVQILRRGVDVIVATPTWLLDMMREGAIDVKHIQVFVLDEADRMLELGLLHDVQRIVVDLPLKRQTMLFSATITREIEQLAKCILSKPTRIADAPTSGAGKPIAQSVYFVENPKKIPLLASLLQGESIDRVLIFTRTKHGATRVTESLVRAGFSAIAIHGHDSRSAHARALLQFKNGEIRIVVATDLAARGLDLEDFSHVINYDMPADADSYVHRIARTGRGGQQGTALSFCSPQDRPDLNTIERVTRLRFETLELPSHLAPVGAARRAQTSP